MEYNNSGCAWVIDSGRLAAVTGLDPDLWLTCAEAFHDGPELVVPWLITEKIAQSAAERQPDPLLEIIERDEAEARREARSRALLPRPRITPRLQCLCGKLHPRR